MTRPGPIWRIGAVIAAVAFALALSAANGLAVGPAAAADATKSPAAQDPCPQAASGAGAGNPAQIRCRIIGGVEAPEGYAPWQVSLYWDPADNKASHYCGGVFVAQDWVLTAAHCVLDQQRQAMTFRVFADSQDLTTGGAVYDWDLILSPKTYSPVTNDGDLALVHVRAVNRSTRPTPVKTIPLITPDMESSEATPPTQLTVSGWGVTDNGTGAHSAQLRMVTLPLVSNTTCGAAYGFAAKNMSNMICAGGQAGADSCKGDSGGPLVLNDGPDQVLVGIVSAGSSGGCALARQYGIYTRVSRYLDWISSNEAAFASGSPPIDAVAYSPQPG